jgi:SpoVK/Ycf46/Vps4 family AAA+-type ATPase
MPTGKRLEELNLPPEATSALRSIRDQMRALSHGTGRTSLTGIPLVSGMAVLVDGATAAARNAVAEALASDLQRDLFRLDLAAVANTYIGETEKNLDRVFSLAQQAGAVLYFEEADALFGRRTDVKDSHDRYANIEVSYLLQRIEAYQGLALLATNTRENIDSAFLRRIRYVIGLETTTGQDRG